MNRYILPDEGTLLRVIPQDEFSVILSRSKKARESAEAKRPDLNVPIIPVEPIQWKRECPNCHSTNFDAHMRCFVTNLDRNISGAMAEIKLLERYCKCTRCKKSFPGSVRPSWFSDSTYSENFISSAINGICSGKATQTSISESLHIPVATLNKMLHKHVNSVRSINSTITACEHIFYYPFPYRGGTAYAIFGIDNAPSRKYPVKASAPLSIRFYDIREHYSANDIREYHTQHPFEDEGPAFVWTALNEEIWDALREIHGDVNVGVIPTLLESWIDAQPLRGPQFKYPVFLPRARESQRQLCWAVGRCFSDDALFFDADSFYAELDHWWDNLLDENERNSKNGLPITERFQPIYNTLQRNRDALELATEFPFVGQSGKKVISILNLIMREIHTMNTRGTSLDLMWYKMQRSINR